MPLQINEIVIKAVVGGSNKDKSTNKETQDNKEDIIRECVEQVMEILKEKSER